MEIPKASVITIFILTSVDVQELERFKAKRYFLDTIPGNLTLNEKFIKKGYTNDERDFIEFSIEADH